MYLIVIWKVFLLLQKAILEEAVTEQGLDMESAKIDFLTFCLISSKFMTEEDEEGLKEELKEAFRIYDRDGQGFITTDVLKEILREIDSELTEDDLDNIIEEVDEDGSGTLDFDGKRYFIPIHYQWNKFRLKTYLCKTYILPVHFLFSEFQGMMMG